MGRTILAETCAPVPGWVELGPEVEVNGYPAREVLGDWSHLHEWDQPPQYLVEGFQILPKGAKRAVNPNRKAVKCGYPGKDIEELKGRHSGKVALLFNGASLALHDLHKIKCPIIGLNRTYHGYPGYTGPQPDYLCAVDKIWFTKPDVQNHPGLINGSNDMKPYGYRVARCPRMAPFSFDLKRDGFVGPIPCTTGHLALQVAVYLGFTELYCLGLDMGGPHFDKSNASTFIYQANAYHRRQAKVLKDQGINVWVCGSPDSKCDAFPHATFEELCG